jgi:DNA/RNA-binding domain of Phe-tRNA-synthetase-like protein
MMGKVCRILSNRVASNIHIDDFNKAMIVVAIRAKEDYVAQLKEKNEKYRQMLEYIANGNKGAQESAQTVLDEVGR